MNIFFTASIKGGRANQPQYMSVIAVLKEYGTVSSEHIGSDEISEYGEIGMRSQEIYDREMNALEHADIVVAEVTTASMGVGYFIAKATTVGKKVIALYNREDDLRLSAIIKGDNNVTVHPYDDANDVRAILDAALKKA